MLKVYQVWREQICLHEPVKFPRGDLRASVEGLRTCFQDENSKLFISDEYSKTLCEIVRSYEFRTRGGSSVGTALAGCLETPQMPLEP